MGQILPIVRHMDQLASDVIGALGRQKSRMLQLRLGRSSARSPGVLRGVNQARIQAIFRSDDFIGETGVGRPWVEAINLYVMVEHFGSQGFGKANGSRF